jgi:YbbR domain-containing protein
VKEGLHRFFKTNPWLKLTSLILSILLWFFVVSQGRSVVIIDVPVGFRNIPADLEVMDGPKSISITIEGQERVLKRLRTGDVSVVLDLAKVKKGNTIFPIKPDDVVLPNMLTVTDISPQTIKLKIEGKIKKKVPVRTVVIGAPAQGFFIDRVEAVPSTVEVSGAESEVKKIYSIKTEPVDITGITNSIQQRAYLDVGRNNIKLGTTDVEVRIEVKRAGK